MTNPEGKSLLRLPTTQTGWMWVVLALALVGLIYYAYWVQPVGLKDMSPYRWLVVHWETTSNYSHGPLIPFIAAGIIWWKRKALLGVTLRPAKEGLFVLVVAMVLYYVGIKAVEGRTSVISFIVLLYGLTLSLAGREAFRVLFFPITFLFLMIPLNFLDEVVGFPLRQFVSQAATVLLNLVGIKTYRIGTGIHSNVFEFDVADPCSGIRSLMALTTITAAYAYVTQTVWWKRWVLFLSAMPLAVLGNLGRVISIALVAQVYGQELASKAYHDYSGYILFSVALSAMVIEGQLLNFHFRRVLDYWLKPASEIQS